MPSPTLVIAQKDPNVALGLVNDLEAHFARVEVANTTFELRTMLVHHKARVAVIDLEILNLDELRQMTRTFPDLAVISTHRSPDERMWMAALGAGAVEFCHPGDIRSILRASRCATRPPLSIAA